MPDIVLTTLNAKYIHAAFGLRYLLANLGPLRANAGIVEFDINQRHLDVAEVLLARTPKIIGFGIFSPCSLILIPSPPQNKTTFMASSLSI